jgi:iron complex outermembrane receptor protein
MHHLRALVATTALLTGTIGMGAHAQAADTPEANNSNQQVSEVIVTAQKRAERVQDVPLSVTGFGAQALKQATVTNLTDLDGRIPNVTLESVATFPNASSFSIRGLGFGDVESTFEPTVGVEVNGVYLARNVGATQDLFDIDTIEVRRGPQGTLDGGNTIGGVVALTTKKPGHDYAADVEVTGGDHGRFELRGAADFPFVPDVLAARISIMDLNYDGYLRNIVNGAHMGGISSFSQRLTLVYTPTKDFDATVVVDHDTDRDRGFPNLNGTPPVGSIAPAPDFLLAEIGYPMDPNQKPYDVNVTYPIRYDYSTIGASATLNWRLDFGTITSVTGYREYDDNNVNEYGGAGDIATLGPVVAPFFTSARIQNQDQFSQELRIASPTGTHLIDYVAGLYYLHQHYDLQNAEGGALFQVYPPNLFTTQFAHQDQNSYAVFGQVEFHFTEQFTLTAGGRYSYEDKSFHNTPVGYYPTQFNYSDNWSDFSPKAALSYKFTPDIMAYVQYARGYRSGGFNGRAGSETSAGPYGAEHVDSYEIGLKNEFFDHRWVVNIAGFISKYADIQEEVQRLSPVTGFDETVVENAGAATYAGIEVESHAFLGHGFSLDTSVGYLDGHFDSFVANLNGACSPGEDPYFCGTNNYKDIPLPGVPHWTVGGALNYHRELPFALFDFNFNGTYTTDQYTSLTPINVVAPWFTLRKANAILNSTVSLSTLDQKYRLSVWVKNLTDQHVLYDRFTVGPLSAPMSFQPPLTWGVALEGKF